MQKDLGGLIERLYNFFYSKFYKKPFKLDLKLNKNDLQIQNFISLLARHYQIDSIDINFLIKYLSWSFSRRFGQLTRRDITLGWIIGPKAFRSWLEKKEEETYYVDQFVNNIGINVNELKMQLHEPVELDGLDPAEELEKKRFEDADAQLYHCTQFTTLYNHRSKTCLLCENKSTCKRLLSARNPQLFNKRGYTA